MEHHRPEQSHPLPSPPRPPRGGRDRPGCGGSCARPAPPLTGETRCRPGEPRAGGLRPPPPLFKPLPAASASRARTRSLRPAELTGGGPAPRHVHTATHRPPPRPPAPGAPPIGSAACPSTGEAIALAGGAAHHGAPRLAPRPSPSRTPRGC